ncbi:hypothetical protein AOQ84DRAFT_401271 [Glonium stellatum]|uniref:Uncharacterized protein n=1 Tax=Glonium stellatum TaxID=574774 RepID=A0A8E2EPQ7_9PEZI|nr:hypothetical protein AOQ84DRAFT_401271 [Glonium stellatum]
MSTSTPPRRFKPEPVETSTKSSRKAAAEPTETTAKVPRRFLPEPVETITRTSRRFNPNPVATSVNSSATKPTTESASNTRGKFSPQPVETTTRSNRKKVGNEDGRRSLRNAPQATENRPRRKFAPQLIETAKRSRKAGDTCPAILPSDKTEATPGENAQSSRKIRIKPAPAPPKNTPTSSLGHASQFLETRGSASPLAIHQSSRGSSRSRHSFRVPDLEPIESSESEESNPPSLSTSPSAASDHSYMYKEATRMRESVDERFSGYLLELAARAAEKQLRDQAMAAFPNDEYHEPVDHFIDRDSDESDLSSGRLSSHEKDEFSRRESAFTKVNWELLAMQQHREKLEQQQERDRKKREAEMNRARRQSVHGPWGNPAAAIFASSSMTKNYIGGWQRDGEMERMRSGARPPMLGGDIEFPRCHSPEPARFDPTQGSHAIRNAMCYLTEQSQHSGSEGGLWHGNAAPCNRPSLWSNASSRPASRGGLWGGCCVGSGQTPPRGPTGLMTPRVEVDNPLEMPQSTSSQGHLPPSPPASNADITSIDEKLTTEVSIEEEFGDNFVTQVYNYLSLGYASIARNFDEELSKISRIPLPELRQDDHLAQSRGYIRLGEDGNLKDTEITEETCMRWRALRLYIQEWARQQPRMAAGVNSLGGFGVAARRGSWAL